VRVSAEHPVDLCGYIRPRHIQGAANSEGVAGGDPTSIVKHCGEHYPQSGSRSTGWRANNEATALLLIVIASGQRIMVLLLPVDGRYKERNLRLSSRTFHYRNRS
jgi:hypothetical protein